MIVCIGILNETFGIFRIFPVCIPTAAPPKHGRLKNLPLENASEERPKNGKVEDVRTKPGARCYSCGQKFCQSDIQLTVPSPYSNTGIHKPNLSYFQTKHLASPLPDTAHITRHAADQLFPPISGEADKIGASPKGISPIAIARQPQISEKAEVATNMRSNNLSYYSIACHCSCSTTSRNAATIVILPFLPRHFFLFRSQSSLKSTGNSESELTHISRNADNITNSMCQFALFITS